MKKLLFLLTIFPSLSFASNCIDPENLDATRACLNKQARISEMQLSNAYQSALKGLDEEDKKNLVAAQRLWVKYKEADCDFISTNIGKADRVLGQIYGRQCANDRAIQRTSELKTLFK